MKVFINEATNLKFVSVYNFSDAIFFEVVNMCPFVSIKYDF